jgi:chromate reductase
MFPLNRPEVMIGNCTDKFDAEGNLTDETARKLIARMLQELADWTHKLRDGSAKEQASSS